MSLTAGLFTLSCSDALFYAFVDDDRDGDGIYDLKDNCLNTANPEQKDTDNDSVGDACDDKSGKELPPATSTDAIDDKSGKELPPATSTDAIDDKSGKDPLPVTGIDTGGDDTLDVDEVDTDEDGEPDATDVDDDNDGLIEIHDLNMFNHIKNNLAGTSYKTSGSGTDDRKGAPEENTDDCKTATMDGSKSFYLCGYELARDLNFTDETSYANGKVKNRWQPNKADPDSATNAGFIGINGFAGIFEGNEYSLSNLYSRNTASSNVHIGLFRTTTVDAVIRNLGVINFNSYGSNIDNEFIGFLVGINQGSIIACYATGGTVNNGDGYNDYVGGLVGQNQGNISASYATGAVNGGDGNADYVGGLVGQNQGNISASFATGAVNGGAGDDIIGGLVGWHFGGNIIASYTTTGTTNGGAGVDYIGSLVGWSTGNITASYATGDAKGGAGDDHVGGLVGLNSFSEGSSITASYATGNAEGGDGGSDKVGNLIGNRTGIVRIIAGYSFGEASKGTVLTDGTPPHGVTEASDLTADNVGIAWDSVDQKTRNAWDFTAGKAPALKYADYDGTGGTDYCALFPDKIPGTDTTLVCNSSLLPGQRP